MEFTPETVTELVEKKIAFVERMGLKVLELRPGSVKLMAPLEETKITLAVCMPELCSPLPRYRAVR